MDEIFPEAAPPASTSIAVAAGPDQSFTPPVRVWLVDDNDEIRELVADLLSLQGGIECARHFSSPDALLSTLASQPGPDVILLDVQMGDRNGLDAVRPIKSLTRSTRVLMFSTCYNQVWRERALGDGASDYLLKSETMEKVAARIRCPADDPAPISRRLRRSTAATKTPLAGHSARPIMDKALRLKTSRLLTRTLKMLGLHSLHN